MSDPTHGRIDPDIQQAVEETLCTCAATEGSMRRCPVHGEDAVRREGLGKRVAMENTLQTQRDKGELRRCCTTKPGFPHSTPCEEAWRTDGKCFPTNPGLASQRGASLFPRPPVEPGVVLAPKRRRWRVGFARYDWRVGAYYDPAFGTWHLSLPLLLVTWDRQQPRRRRCR